MRRHLFILEFALSGLCRRRYKNLALLVAYSLLIFIISSILFLTHALKREAELLLQSSPEITVQRLMAGRHALVPVDWVDTIVSIPGVIDASPRYWGYYYDPFTGANFTVLGVRSSEFPLKGREDLDPEDCLIGSGVSETGLLRTGDSLVMVDPEGIARPFRVAGVFSTSSSILTNDLVVLKEETIKRFFQIPEGYAVDLVVRVANPSEIDTIAKKIKEKIPSSRPITRTEILRTYESLFDWRSGMVLSMFIGALLAFFIFAWDKATGLSAEERREIGVLKAIGWDSSDIMEMKFWEGLVLSSLAYLTGTITGFVHVFMLGAPLLESALKGWSVLFPSLKLRPVIEVYQLMVLLFLTVVPYMAATIAPSWKAAMTDPEEVIRS